MKCNILNCSGEYEKRYIVHTVKYHGKIIVIDNVPAEVCPICEDVLFTPETVRQIEKFLTSNIKPVDTVPLYEFSYSLSC